MNRPAAVCLLRTLQFRLENERSIDSDQLTDVIKLCRTSGSLLDKYLKL